MPLDVFQLKRLVHSTESKISTLVFGKTETDVENAQKWIDTFIAFLQDTNDEELQAEIEQAREDSKDSWMFDEELQDETVHFILGASKRFPKKLSRAKHNYVASPLAATRPRPIKWCYCNRLPTDEAR